ncbi:MAG: hypothetical protein KJ726_09850, partial [Verrucomicrobia bacterium]|nr:hypothetical protein [Verrucomicrobiota bacterium]
AQKARDEAKVTQDLALEQKAVELYKLAAEAYQEYRQRYPRDADFYQINFYYADSLYFSFRFLAAAEQYEKVRDMQDGVFREESAQHATRAYELYIGELVGENHPDSEAFRKALPELEPPSREVVEETVEHDEAEAMGRAAREKCIRYYSREVTERELVLSLEWIEQKKTKGTKTG